MAFFPGSHNTRSDTELLLWCAVQPAGNSICDSGCSGDITLPSGERLISPKRQHSLKETSVMLVFPLVGRSETAGASGELYAASVLSGMSQQLWQDVDCVAVNISYLLVVIFSLVTAAIWDGNNLTWFLYVLALEVSGFQIWVLSFFWMRFYLTCLVVKLDLKLDLCDEIHMRFYCVMWVGDITGNCFLRLLCHRPSCSPSSLFLSLWVVMEEYLDPGLCLLWLASPPPIKTFQ